MLSENALIVLKKRYLLRDKKGKLIETPKQLFRRVAKVVSKGNKKLEKEFFNVMSNLEFLPNSPALMNAGTQLGQLSACFVLPVEDSLTSIFDTVKNAALIHQSGGGTGFNFSRLRPKGDLVQSTHGVASGPVSFMAVIDKATDVIKQGGKRRGANMGILNVNHPDITEFITAKNKPVLNNFNISVAVTDKFMEAVKKNKSYDLIDPRTGKRKKESARKIFSLIAYNAWKNGDPGLIFIDEINRHNPTPELGRIEATNPCGEVPLLPYESCILGSINLNKAIDNKKINFKRLEDLVRTGVVFLNNVIDVNKYPLGEIEKITKKNRKIGLGVMGFADMLVKLGIPYDSEKAVRTGEEIMKFIKEKAKKYSRKNKTLTTIAPTGTISLIADCSSGIEPLFAIAFVKEVLGGTNLLIANKEFEKIAKEKGFYSKKLTGKIAKKGSLKGIKEIPKEIRMLFATALDIKPEWHLRMQAAFQKHIDNAVSKTINLPNSATVNDVKNIFLLAHKLKCKGITIYRYGSKPEQVLYVDVPKKILRAKAEFGSCPAGVCYG